MALNQLKHSSIQKPQTFFMAMPLVIEGNTVTTNLSTLIFNFTIKNKLNGTYPQPFSKRTLTLEFINHFPV